MHVHENINQWLLHPKVSRLINNKAVLLHPLGARSRHSVIRANQWAHLTPPHALISTHAEEAFQAIQLNLVEVEALVQLQRRQHARTLHTAFIKRGAGVHRRA